VVGHRVVVQGGGLVLDGLSTKSISNLKSMIEESSNNPADAPKGMKNNIPIWEVIV
jgi:hypothetical protein